MNFTAASECIALIFFLIIAECKDLRTVILILHLRLGFVTIGVLFDVGVWYYVKDVKIFDEEIELEQIADEPAETIVS